MSYQFYVPTRTMFGAGKLNELHAMGGLFGADPCELSHEECVAIYRKSYR